jgi:hypothetical protein
VRECLPARRPDGIAPFEQGEIGPDLFRAACNMGLEGMVSKRADRPYRAGRSKDWVKMLWGGRTARGCGTLGALSNAMERHMSQPFEASRSLTALEQHNTIIAVIDETAS